jgi:hypothetical protein
MGSLTIRNFPRPDDLRDKLETGLNVLEGPFPDTYLCDLVSGLDDSIQIASEDAWVAMRVRNFRRPGYTEFWNLFGVFPTRSRPYGGSVLLERFDGLRPYLLLGKSYGLDSVAMEWDVRV